MSNRDILAIGASAGGVEALLFLARHLSAPFPAAILVTLHLSSQFRSSLDELLGRAGPLPAGFAVDGEPLRKGQIYIAPPDRHLLVDGTRLVLGSGPRENNSRPAIDAMLRSAAVCCGSRTIGVVLTGTLSDGASGLWALGRSGGIAVVQDPRDAAFAEMPTNALARARPDHVVGLDELPALLGSLVEQSAGPPQPVADGLRFEVEIARGSEGGSMQDMDALGQRSVLACPDCHGVMWEIEEDELARYRCHVGHTYSAERMYLALDENLRRALGSALRALEERVALTSKLEQQARQSGRTNLTTTWAAKASEAQAELDVLRSAVARIDEMAAQQGLAQTG